MYDVDVDVDGALDAVSRLSFCISQLYEINNNSRLLSSSSWCYQITNFNLTIYLPGNVSILLNCNSGVVICLSFYKESSIEKPAVLLMIKLQVL
jgi:hypothetical protein